MAASVLYEAFGKDFLKLDVPYIKEMDRAKLSFVVQMMEKNLNCPLTSSCGRLFDAVASLLCICHTITHESQAAMELEAVADENLPGEGYDFQLTGENTNQGLLQIDFSPAVRQIAADLQAGHPLSAISTKFHYTMVSSFAAAAKKISEETCVKKIVLSGGVFNNDMILNQMIALLEKYQFTVYTHTQVPAGDGGISLGQAVVAAALGRIVNYDHEIC